MALNNPERDRRDARGYREGSRKKFYARIIGGRVLNQEGYAHRWEWVERERGEAPRRMVHKDKYGWFYGGLVWNDEVGWGDS